MTIDKDGLVEEAQVFADRDWWQSAGDVLNLQLHGWTFRNSASFYDRETRQHVEMTPAMAKRLIALALPNTGDELVARLNSAASIIEQWDAWEIGAANKPTVRLTVSPSKLLREAVTAIRALKEVR